MNQLSRQLPRWVPTQQAVRQLLAPALVFIVACLDRQFQTDFWMHLARGREIVDTGQFITTDHFTIAGAGVSVRDANWLSQIFYFRLFSWGGLPLIQVCNALTLSAALWLLVRVCRHNGTSWRSAAAGGVIAFLVAWQTFLIRPQTFSVLLFVLLYGVLSEGASSLFVLLICPPLLLLLWVNLHGGFVIGLVLIGVFVLASIIDGVRNPGKASNAKWLLASLLLSALTTLINPYGWRIYQYAFSLTATVMPRHIEEWMPPPMNQWIGQGLVGSALLVAGLYLLKRRVPTVRESLLLLCFFPLALHSARMVIWWAIVVAPIVASLLGSFEDEPTRRPSRVSSIMSVSLCAVLIGLCILSLPWLEKVNPIFTAVRSPHRIESDLDNVARAGLDTSRGGSGIVFARMDWGQYLDWRLGPHRRLLIDGHVELASDQIWHEYCQAISGDPYGSRSSTSITLTTFC